MILKLFRHWLEKQVHVGLTHLEALDHLTLSGQPSGTGARPVSSKHQEPAAWERPAAKRLLPKWEEVGSCTTIDSILDWVGSWNVLSRGSLASRVPN